MLLVFSISWNTSAIVVLHLCTAFLHFTFRQVVIFFPDPLISERDSEGGQYQQRIVELERQVVEQTDEVNRLKQHGAVERQRIETGQRTIAQQLETYAPRDVWKNATLMF